MDCDALHARLARAHSTLVDLAIEMESVSERTRLKGKAQGVRLALSYLDEARRDVPTGGPVCPCDGPGGPSEGDSLTVTPEARKSAQGASS